MNKQQNPQNVQYVQHVQNVQSVQMHNPILAQRELWWTICVQCRWMIREGDCAACPHRRAARPTMTRRP